MNKKGLTLVELIISITISAILFGSVFVFISDSLEGLQDSNTKTRIMDNIFNSKNKISRYIKSGYVFSKIIGTGGVSNKVLYLKTEDNSKGVIFGIVNFDSMKLQDYNIYGRNNIGYRDLSAKEVGEVDLDNSKVYSLIFNRDKIIDNSIIKSFEPDLYNSGSIINLDIEYIEQLNESYLGENIDNIIINKDLIYKTNLIF